MAQHSTDDFLIRCDEPGKVEQIYDFLQERGSEDIETGMVVTDLQGVIDALGYQGSRDGVDDRACVKDIELSDGEAGPELRFSVHDNFSVFDICRALATAFGADLQVDACYSIEEGPGFLHVSDPIRFTARDETQVERQIDERIRGLVEAYGHGSERFELVEPLLVNGTYLESVGPRSELHFTEPSGYGEPIDKDIMVSSLRSQDVLDDVLDCLEVNFRLMEQVEGHTMMERSRSLMLRELYGSSSAYQNISEYMKGFDLVYLPPMEVDSEDALEIAEKAVDYNGHVVNMYEEVEALIEKGYSPIEALHEWDIDVPDSYTYLWPAMSFSFDGKPVLILCEGGDGKMRVVGFDPDAAVSLKDATGRDFLSMLGVGAADELYGGTVSKAKMMSVAKDFVLSDVNRKAFREAEQECSRKLRQQEVYGRLAAAPGKGEDNGKGIK